MSTATLPSSAATSTVIDFGDYPAEISGTPAAPDITNRYEPAGVTFSEGVTALRHNARSLPRRPDLPASPEVVITTCYSREFCANRIVMAFTGAMQRVSVLAGTSSGLPAAEDVLLTAFAEDGSVVSRAVRTLPPSGGPIPVGTPSTSVPPSLPTDTSGAGPADVVGQPVAMSSTTDPWVWMLLIVAAGAVTAALLSGRLVRDRRRRTDPAQGESRQQPMISIHAGHGTTAVSGPRSGAPGPVLTLTAVLARPKTTLTLEDS